MNKVPSFQYIQLKIRIIITSFKCKWQGTFITDPRVFLTSIQNADLTSMEIKIGTATM